MKLIQKEDLTIADLKAAYDFNRLQMKSLKKEIKNSKNENERNYKNNGGYRELMTVNETLYNELLNKVSLIEIDFKNK